MSRVIVVSPHPDDETLGCAGTLFWHREKGDSLHWLIMTCLDEKSGYNKQTIDKRNIEISNVAESYLFSSVRKLDYPTTTLDAVPIKDIIGKVAEHFQDIQPEIIYLPYPGDIHTDHDVTFKVLSSCTKWFRHPYVTRILLYETISETDFAINPDINSFRPNVFVNISDFMDKKLAVMKMYEGEMAGHPFPRSEETIRALAVFRGAQAGFSAAEAFMLLKEIMR